MFPIHGRFPKEMAVIGRLLVDYGELELDLMNCIQVVCGFDLNSTFKAMFRIRGETNRIDIADALGRKSYKAVGLADDFDRTIDQMRHCLKIRNKYAHAYWHDPDQGKALCYVSVEELAKTKDEVDDLDNLSFLYIDEPLLLQQEAYFLNTRALMTFLNFEAQGRQKSTQTNPFEKPDSVEKPPFFRHKVP